MLWYSVPFMGYYSKNFKRFKGKFLRLSDHSKAGVLDPRFPEVREFLAETYEKALKNWGIDGFKLDFIDQFTITGTDPAIAENYAGRDYKSVPEATDALMKEITARLQRIKPDILIEFRQAYMGPAIRQYGNMIRVGDCPGDLQANRIGIANLRLTSGTTAVHADMLEWNKEEYPLNVARTIISCIFGVIQYSAMLRDIPQDNQNVIRHWLTFSQEHQDALLKGQFKPYSPEAGFPVIKAENNQERIIAVYQDNMAVNVGKKDKNIYILNGTYNYYIIAEVPANLKLKTFDMYGKETSNTKLKPGIQYLPIPAGGYGLLY
jgi:alpha-galactosidase